MNSRFKSAVSILLVTCLLAACNAEPQKTEETTVPVQTSAVVTETAPEPTPVPEPESVFPKYKYLVSAPVIQESTDITKLVTFYIDGTPIKGKITFPEGEGPFKTIIISSGLYGTLGRYTKKAKRYSKAGYCVIEFKFRNGTAPKPYKDPKYLGDFIYEQVKDLNAIIDATKYIPQVDQSNIYLYGHSMGGLDTAYAGLMRENDIKGLILVDPSFYALKRMKFEKEKTLTTDIFPIMAKSKMNVLIITGTKGSFGEDPHNFDDAMVTYPNSYMVILDGADHHFDGVSGDKVVDRSVEILHYWDANGKPD